jgi:hypothetical protein
MPQPLTLLWPQILAILGPWAVAGVSSVVWLRKHETPIPRLAWSLFMALCMFVLFNPARFLVIGLFDGASRPASLLISYFVGAGVVALLWALLTKAFFRRATALQIVLTSCLGFAYEIWRTSPWLAIALEARSARGA